MEQQIASHTELSGLLGIINDQKKQLEAKDKRIQFLESRLAQRIVKTQNLYQQRKTHFSDMQDRAYQIFLDFPEIGFTYEELVEEWNARYPSISPVNLPRRVRELAEQSLLWDAFDPETRKVYHYLRLEELEEGEERE
jgi:hypothetical protein